jgi:hypothetical protein
MPAWSVISRIFPHVIIVLFAALLTTSAGWFITSSKLSAERLGRANDRLLYEQAQQNATINALNEKLVKEAEYDKIKAKADADYSRLLDEFRATLVRYKAAKGTTGRDNLPSPADSPAVDARPGQDTFIPVSESDLLICAENTAKALTAHEWAKSITDSSR